MSVQRYETADGTRWRVRWREANRMRSKTLGSRSEAKALDLDIRARKLRADILPSTGRWTLDRAWAEWKRKRGLDKAPSTMASYEAMWKAHVEGTLGAASIASLISDPKQIEDHLADLKAAGVGPAARRKVMMILSAVFRACVFWREAALNPIREMEKPSAKRGTIPRPFPPLVIEWLRQQVSSRETRDKTGLRPQGDACLLGVLSYAGLRPSEALCLTFADLGVQTIAVDKAVRMGTSGPEIGPTKTEEARAAPLVSSLREDLEEWREARSAASSALVFPSSSGGLWSRSTFDNWRSRVWKPAIAAVADAHPEHDWIRKARLYDCRGSFVSLRLRAGVPPLEVAAEAGHSPQVMFNHYAREIKELRGEQIMSADAQIRRAQELLTNEPSKTVAKLIDASLKPPEQVDFEVRSILYGDFPRSKSPT